MRWIKRKKVGAVRTIPQRDHPFHALEDPVRADYRGNPTLECICGSNMLLMCAAFDPDTREPGLYLLDGMCAHCGALVTLPTPVDKVWNK
jgi:hypothetical protein